MEKLNKTTQDYKREIKELEIKKELLENEIRQYLLNITKAYPNAIITEIDGVKIKAMSIAIDSYIKSIDIAKCILYAQRIENWFTKQNSVFE